MILDAPLMRLDGDPCLAGRAHRPRVGRARTSRPAAIARRVAAPLAASLGEPARQPEHGDGAADLGDAADDSELDGEQVRKRRKGFHGYLCPHCGAGVGFSDSGP